MKFADKLYVGFQRDRYAAADEPRVLGFAVPYGTLAAEKKRMETVDRWSNDKSESRIIENKPTRGFKLLQVVSRYSTQNKLFRVLDPRGFELEISADNLLDVALVSTIVRGEIIEECVWGQDTSIRLIPGSSEEYRLWKTSVPAEKQAIVSGGYYSNPGNLLSIFRFEGIFQRTSLSVKHIAEKALAEQRSQNNWSTYFVTLVTKLRSEVTISMDEKPSYIYTEFVLGEDGGVERKITHARKSHFKGLRTHEGELSAEITEHALDPLCWVADGDKYYSRWSRDKDALIQNSSGGAIGFFKTKSEARAFDYFEIAEKFAVEKGFGYANIDTSELSNGPKRNYHLSYPIIEVAPTAERRVIVKDER